MVRTNIALLALTALLVAAMPAAAETIQIEMPASLGSHVIDLGFPVAVVHSASLHISGEAQLRYYHCIHDGPGGYHEYDHQEPQRVYTSITSNGESMDTDFWYFGNGEFAADMPFVIWGDDGDRLFSDGTGVLDMASWIELYPPESEDCGVTDPGYITFDDTMVLTLEIERTVPTGTTAWGFIKAAYR